jgi:TldD protein
MRALTLPAAALAASFALVAQAPTADPVLQALRDEAQRSRGITVSDLEAPYFVQYVVDEADTFSVMAVQGGLISRRRDRARAPEVQVRVGDYKFDNTNFAGGGGGSRYDLGSFPLDNSYPALRHYLWLQTDSAYKSALEAFSRKRAALRNVSQNDQLSDFAHAAPVRQLGELHGLRIDEDAWAARVRSLSAVFSRFPGVRNSSVELQASDGGYYVVNSEGAEVREPENVTFVRARAQAQAPDGMVVTGAVAFHALEPEGMPSETDMASGIEALARNVSELAQAPMGEDYNGPVLFEGEAGPQVFAELLGRNLAPSRRMVGERGNALSASEFEGRIGARVLPDSFTVVDDPTQKEWRGRPLFGSYSVDREGVAAKPLRLVEKGALKGYLLTRQPIRGFEGSNGRARMPGQAAMSNLFVSSTDVVPAAELKKKLIELIQARGLPFGILIRRMDFPSSASVDQARRMISAAQGGKPVSAPALAYKVYPDGREQLVRGLRFRGFNARSLKDILASGDDARAFDFLNNSAPFALIGGSNYMAETCVVAPSILVDDLELHPVEEEQPKLPIAAPPEPGR